MDSNESFSVRRDLNAIATSNLVNRRPEDGFRARDFRETFQFRQENTETQHQTRYHHLLAYSSPIHYSPDVLIFHALQCKVLDTSLHRTRIGHIKKNCDIREGKCR